MMRGGISWEDEEGGIRREEWTDRVRSSVPEDRKEGRRRRLVSR